MQLVYFDTNIFIYLFNPASPFHLNCQKLVTYCQKNNLTIVTSAETFQEIIHYSKNIKQLTKGIDTAKITLEIADQILSITENTIQIYLNQAQTYQSSGSRDLIHLSVCLENKLKNIITYDEDFNKFKQVKALKPEEFLT